MRILGLASFLMFTAGCLALPGFGGDGYWESADTGWADWGAYSSWPDSEQGRLVAEAEAWGTMTGAVLSPDGGTSHAGMSTMMCGFDTRSGNMGYDVSPGGQGETEVIDTTEQDGNVIVMARQNDAIKLYQAGTWDLTLEDRLPVSRLQGAGFADDGSLRVLSGTDTCSVTTVVDGRIADRVYVDAGACYLGELQTIGDGAYVATGDDAVWVSDGQATSLGVRADVISAADDAVYAASGSAVTGFGADHSQRWQAEVDGVVVDMAAIEDMGVAVLTAAGNTRLLVVLDAADGVEIDRMEATSLTFGVEVSDDSSTLQLTTGTSVAFFSVQ